jgi:hypothetical protein
MRHKVVWVIVLSVVFTGVLCSYGLGAVRFDGLMWYHSEAPERLIVNEEHQLVWMSPKVADQITVKLPAMEVTGVGDIARVEYMFKTEGIKTGVPGTDPTMLSGTGDFRIGLFDSNGGGHIERDRTGYRNEKWRSYLGYCARICPHLPVGIEREHSDAIPGKIMKRSKDWGDDVRLSLVQKAGPYTRSRDLSGFGLKLGEFSKLILQVERKDSKTLEFSITLNGVTYIYIDDEPQFQPQKIDAMAIYFPNPNQYTSITFAGCWFSCMPERMSEESRTFISSHKKGRPDPVE